jgi:hypothetical protein
MRRGFRSRSFSGAKPSFSSTPGRKGSRKTSAFERRDNNTDLEAGDLRSRITEDLRRERVSLGPKNRLGRSMRTTSAPKSERSRLR